MNPSHRERVGEIVRSTGLFLEEEISVALELFDAAHASPSSLSSEGDTITHSAAPSTSSPSASFDYAFLGAFTQDGELTGFACYGPPPGTDRTFELYWIAVDARHQGAGCGSLLLREVERRLERHQARVLVVETSSRSDYASTRAFYLKRGYCQVARVRDYFAPTDDRIIFTKRFHDAPQGHGAVAA
jgi:ribosomal protein S18 acetylase RimI-like enzyme